MGHSYRRAFFSNFRHLFRAIFRSFIFSWFFFFPNIGMLTNFTFLVLENFTNSDRTPPYIDTYLQLFPNFGIYGKNALRQEWILMLSLVPSLNQNVPGKPYN